MSIQTVITPENECTPVWQYLLIMGKDLNGQADQIKALGDAMLTTAVFFAPEDQEKLAKLLDKAAKANVKFITEFRELLEKSTKWED